MTLWVDADSCPKRVREIIAKAAANYDIPCEFVANRSLELPKQPRVSLRVVPAEAESADAYIQDSVAPGDVVVTRDIPLAAELVEREAHVLNIRGTVYTRENVRERLSIRNAMLEFRTAGMVEPGERSFGAKEVKAFAEALDKTLRHRLK